MEKQLSLQKIGESNFIECFNLKLKEGQEKLVSHPIRSLAQAYVYYNQCTPFGVYYKDVMVGYVMVIYDYDEENYNIWHMMIDEKYQNKGYGSEAIKLCIEYIKEKPFGNSNEIILSCNMENSHGIHIYEKLGFKNTGEVDEDEIIMKFILNS